MADNVSLPATGSTVGTDEVSIGGVVQHVQRVKLVDGADGGTELLPGSAARGLSVDPRPNRANATAVSSGLTTAATLYASGDQMGALLELTGMARVAGGGGWLGSLALVTDTPNVISGVRAWFFSGAVAPAADNAALSFSDADMEKYQGHVYIPGPNHTALNGAAIVTNVNLDYVCDATSLFVALETVASHAAHFAAADDLHLYAKAYLL